MQNSSVSGILSENGIESIKQGAGAAADLCMYFFFKLFFMLENAGTASTHTNKHNERNGKVLQFIFPQSYWAVEIVKYRRLYAAEVATKRIFSTFTVSMI